MLKCPVCKENKLRHRHDAAYGMAGTHMAGTERFECECGFSCWDAIDGEKLGLEFVLDIPSDIDRDMRELDEL